jgi:putative ABC transport system permease protein
MTTFSRLRSWLKWMVKGAHLEKEMDTEAAFHIESYAADLVRNGVSAQEAMRRAKIEFGGVESYKDAIRASLGLRWWDELWIDLRYAVRKLRNSPGFTLTAILVLGIGIGVNVAAFSMFNLIVLKLLPVRDPQMLVRLQRRTLERRTGIMPYPSVVFYREHAKTLSAVMATMGARMELEGDSQPVRVNFATANYFSELGTPAAYGRMFDPVREDSPDAAPVVVLNYGFWQRRFGADPTIVGKTIHLNKKSATVIGITPEVFASLGAQYPDVWLPITQQPYFVEGSKTLTDTSNGSVEMWGRLAPGVTAKVAEQEMLELTNELRKLHPKDIWDQEFIRSDPGGHLQVLKPEMYLVMAMVGTLALLILAVACANLGGLLVARGVTREHEIGIRFAIGASRQRVFRQLCTENLLLALLGSAAGLALGYVVVRVILATTEAPAWTSATPDWRLFLFAAGMALASAVFFGLTPALQIARQKQKKTLARQVLVGAQVAASCVLLIVAGLLIRAVQHALHTYPGFGFEQVLTIDPSLANHGYTPAAARTYLEQFKGRLRALPGVTSVALSSMAPLAHDKVYIITTDVGGHQAAIYPNSVEPEYFQTMGIPLMLGRNLLPGETNAVILSQSLARQQWPGENPIGKPFWDKDTVVGVVGNARTMAMNDSDAVEMYHAAQLTDMPDMVVIIKTAGAPDDFMPMVRSISQSLDPKLFPGIRLLKTSFKQEMQTAEQTVTAVSVLGMVAGLLAALGLMGLVAYAVSERTKEIAIRIALGAKPAHILSAILRQFVRPVVLGMMVGVGGTAALSKVLRGMLFGVSNLDPAGYLGGIGVLIIIATVAALVPSRRALRVDPMRILRCD